MINKTFAEEEKSLSNSLLLGGYAAGNHGANATTYNIGSHGSINHTNNITSNISASNNNNNNGHFIGTSPSY